MPISIWTTDHAEYIEELDKQGKTRFEMSVAMSKKFKMRVTPDQVSRLMNHMRTPRHPLFRNLPYRSRGAKHAS